MGIFRLKMKEELIETPPNGNGNIGITTLQDSNCLAEYSVSIIVVGTCWVEFDISSASVVVTKADQTPFVNGEQLTATTEYNVQVSGWRSPNEIQNVLTSSLVIRTKATSGGLVIKQSTIERFHTVNIC